MSANGGVYLGIDVGTTGTKCVAIDARGAVLAEALGEHPVSYPKPGWSEQQPEDWWRSTVEAVRAVVARAPSVARDVAAIGLSGQMHGFV
ncbi:MAG: FGGY family carbohydrate kinase, partial [Planctomycetota bacterium]